MSDETLTEAPETEVQDQPEPEAPDTTDQADREEAEAPNEESFHDLDLSRIPDGEDPREWALKREKEMQAAFTRKTQALASQRQANEEAQEAIELQRLLRDPNTQAQALARLGFDLADEEQEELDPDEELRQKVALLEAERAREHEMAQLTQREQETLAYMGDQLEIIEGREGREFSDEESEAIASIALANPDQQGRPDVERAFKLLSGIWDAQLAARRERKTAPRVPGNGSPASRVVDLSTRESRINAAAQAAEAAMAPQ